MQSLAAAFAETDRKKAMRFAEEAAVQARGLNQPDRPPAMARAGAVLVKLGRADAGRKLIDEAARDAAKLGIKDRAGYYRWLVAEALAPFDLKQALALIEPIQDEENFGRQRAPVMRGSPPPSPRPTRPGPSPWSTWWLDPAFDHELARTEIAYKIGADRPDEAIKIIEGINRDRRAALWQAEAFGWLAVALAPRDRARAFGLIDRALAMMIDHPDGRHADAEMAVAARIAICARRIGYPDMESVVMRVMATRFVVDSPWERNWLVQCATQAALALALIDPDAARTVLEDTEARRGLDATKEQDVREQWLMAWALVDLKRAEALVDAALTELDGAEEVHLWGTGIFQMVEFLLKPPYRREDALGKRSFGGFWWPGESN